MGRSAPRPGALGPQALAWLLVALAASACTTAPVRVEQLEPHEAYRALGASALSESRLSETSRTALRTRGLLALFEQEDPEAALRELHQIVGSGAADERDLFALAEASLLHGDRSSKREHQLAAALYAWAFLFPGDQREPPGRFDSRTRLATEIYNAALVRAFRAADGSHVELRPGSYTLPFGELEVAVDSTRLLWAGRQLGDFLPVAELEVHGLRNRYRSAGLGAPLAARTLIASRSTYDDFVGPRVRVPVTALLRLDGVSGNLGATRFQGALELYATDQTERLVIDGEQVPLQGERTATLAAMLAESPVWKRELAGFFGRAKADDELPLLRAIEPHRRGRVPVVFVHGTASSPGRWADMFNDLWSSQWVRERYEPWFFMYDTGNPVPYSGLGLRDLITRRLEQLDPEGTDACLRQMVVIGHSQGGLLTKLTAIDSGDRLWNGVARKPLDELAISPETRELLRRALFVEHLPSVRRVVFIATPHRGSYQALRRISSWLTPFIRMPGRLLAVGGEIATLQRDGSMAAATVGRLPTSIDNMREGNAFLTALVDIPIASGVGSHSIIPVLDDDPLEDAKDGVVAYRSAHLEGVDSEQVVHPSGHSTQAVPATIEEVRRILGLHADAAAASGLSCGVTGSAGAH